MSKPRTIPEFVTLVCEDCRNPFEYHHVSGLLARYCHGCLKERTMARGRKNAAAQRARQKAGNVERQTIDYVPLVPPAERVKLAEQAKARRLGMDMETFRAVWLPGKVWSLDRGFERVGV